MEGGYFSWMVVAYREGCGAVLKMVLFQGGFTKRAQLGGPVQGLGTGGADK